MKKYLVGALVGAILVFGWLSVSHMAFSYHNASYKVAPNSEAILAAMSGIQEEGQYMLPDMDVNASHDEQEAKMKEDIGKPWAMITYHPKSEYDMGMNMARSFTTCFLSVLFLIAILGKHPGSYSIIVLKSLALGLLMFCFVWYNQSIWMQTPWDVLKAELFDLIASWTLCGLWLGWWLNKQKRSRRSRL